MKEEILKLRDEGKSYKQIVDILGCSKGTVSYHCGKGQKEKTNNRRRKRRENILVGKTERFRERKKKENVRGKKENRDRKDVVEGIRKFQKADSSFGIDRVNKDIEATFIWQDVLDKFGKNTYCYLSGEPINLTVNSYQFDHIIPVSRDGDNSLSNLGIAHEVVNQMKGNLTPDEFIDWCKKVLVHNGFKVEKK